MTKAELIESIASDTGLNKAQAKAAVDSFIDNVTKTLKKRKFTDAKVTLVGFGTFKKVKRKKRKGRNPQTKESMVIPAHNVAVFSAGKKLKDSVK